MSTDRSNRRAFTMIEMLGTLMLFTVFTLVASQLFTQIMRVLDQTAPAHDAMIRFQSVSDTLRRDAWGAHRFSAAGANAIQIESANHVLIRWEIDHVGNIYRSEGEQRQRWVGVGSDVVLEIDGPGIVLRSTSRKVDGGGELRCVSLLSLAAAHGGSK